MLATHKFILPHEYHERRGSCETQGIIALWNFEVDSY